jgi:glycerate kinase
MRVLIAPQEFKGSLTAAEAATAIAAGLGRARPEWELDVAPVSDGGPGFLEAMCAAGSHEWCVAAARDPLGRPVAASYLRLTEAREAVVEAAQANGLWRLGPGELDPLHADTAGVGDLILAAMSEPPSRLIIGVGGSATTDGGAGMARALGARFLDGAGNALVPGGGALAALVRIDWRRPPPFAGTEVVVATDVTNPLVGPNGAAAVYGPQKGATPEQVDMLEAALLRYASVSRRSLGVDVATLPGGGAAGGLAAGLVAFLGARVVSGFDVAAQALRLDARIARAGVVVTGEGSFDAQSAQGKATGRLFERARAAGKQVVVFAGRADQEGPAVRTIASLGFGPVESMERASELLAALAERWAAEAGPAPG